MIRLPDPTGRMTPARKAVVLLAIRRGDFSRDHILRTYGLSEDELQGWERRYAAYGHAGLKVTRIQGLPRG